MSTGRKSVLLIILILLCDQILKIWVKTHMEIGQEIHIFGNWGILHFIENNGMAFGMEMGGKPGKLILSIFRVAAIFGIGWFLSSLITKKANLGFNSCCKCNNGRCNRKYNDSAFYGLIFSESFTQHAVLFPMEEVILLSCTEG